MKKDLCTLCGVLFVLLLSGCGVSLKKKEVSLFGVTLGGRSDEEIQRDREKQSFKEAKKKGGDENADL